MHQDLPSPDEASRTPSTDHHLDDAARMTSTAGAATDEGARR